MTRRKQRAAGPGAIVAALFVYLFLPFVITALYSLATNRSNLAVALAVALALAVVVMVPLTYAIATFAPRMERLMKALTLMPFAIPGVISASALLRAYGGGSVNEGNKWRFTSPTHVVRAFQQALLELREEGGIQARHAR